MPYWLHDGVHASLAAVESLRDALVRTAKRNADPAVTVSLGILAPERRIVTQRRPRNPHSHWLIAASALCSVAATLAAQPGPASKPLTVERIVQERELSAARPRDAAWIPAGKGLSFVRGITGSPQPGIHTLTLQICSMDAANGKEQVLVSTAQLNAALGVRPDANTGDDSNDNPDRLSEFQSYAWAPDGHHLLLTSGNALSWFDLDAHSSRSLVKGKEELGSPLISPDGRSVSFIREHTLWVVDVASGSASTLTHERTSDLRVGEPDWVYRNELGLPTAYWWSPDSSKIAWLETDDRAVDKYAVRSSGGDETSIAYPKPGAAIPAIHLFAQAIGGGKPIQIDLGSDLNVYIPRVQWLPDGKHLAVERLSRSQKTLELLLADTTSGTSNAILTEKDDYWINLGDELHFLKGSSRFVWSSERSGYRHLYLYDLSGHQLAQLTQGDWKVDSLVSVDEKAGAVYFTATKASPLERQLFRVKLDGAALTRLTEQKGTHEVQASPSGALFLDAWSNRSTPPQLDLLHPDGSRIASVNDKQPEDLAPNQLPLPEFLMVKTHMGAELNASIIKPPDFDPSRQYPVLVYIAGGPGEQIIRDAWGGDIQLWLSMMAQKGYIVFALDNRGAAEGGHLFEEPLHLRLSGVEMADQRDGVLYLRGLPWVDKTRIGICGWGYGGFLALHGMLDRPVLFKAGFAGSPVTDWHLYDAVFAERYLEDPTRNQDGWLASSPTENARYLKTPLLIAQATMDEKVHVENSMMLLDEFLDQGKYPDILLFPDRHSLFEDRGSRQILFQRLTDFFVKNL
jgi:dipeptidyl-peptidase 4